jgi:Trypsin-like peptidase domain
MTAPWTMPRTSSRHVPATPHLLPVAILLAAALVAAALLPPDDPAPGHPPDFSPLRVTSGGEIATGFAVGADRVLTVAHVVDGALKVDGTRARVLRVDRGADLALLGVPGIAARAPAVAAAGAGDEVRVVRLRGDRLASRSVHVRRAIVAHVRAPGAERALTRPALELAARVEAGDSGAPVLSRSGALAGVLFAASSRRENTAYAVDASAVARLLARE